MKKKIAGLLLVIQLATMSHVVAGNISLTDPVTGQSKAIVTTVTTDCDVYESYVSETVISCEQAAKDIQEYLKYYEEVQARSIEANKKDENFPVLKIDNIDFYARVLYYVKNKELLDENLRANLEAELMPNKVLNTLLNNFCMAASAIRIYNQEAYRNMMLDDSCEHTPLDRKLILDTYPLDHNSVNRINTQYGEDTIYRLAEQGFDDMSENGAFKESYYFYAHMSSGSEATSNLQPMTPGGDLAARTVGGAMLRRITANEMEDKFTADEVKFYFSEHYTDLYPDDMTLVKADRAIENCDVTLLPELVAYITYLANAENTTTEIETDYIADGCVLLSREDYKAYMNGDMSVLDQKTKTK